MAASLDHLHLKCKDPEESAKFYKEMFGARETARVDLRGAPTIRMDLNGVTINLSGRGPGETELYTNFGLAHYGIKVDNLEQMYQKLRGHGVTFLMEPTQSGPELKISFFRGPSGEIVEMMERKPAK